MELLELDRAPSQSIDVVNEDPIDGSCLDVVEHAGVLRSDLAGIGRRVVVHVLLGNGPVELLSQLATVGHLAFDSLGVTFAVEGDAGVDGGCSGRLHKGSD